MALIELCGVTKRYKIGEQEILALNGIDLVIEQGERRAPERALLEVVGLSA